MPSTTTTTTPTAQQVYANGVSNASAIAMGVLTQTGQNNVYGLTGAGVTIGVISDSYNANGGAAADQAAYNVPAVDVLSDSTGSDEGRAMTELAYKIAPGASFDFAAGGSNGLTSCAAAVTSLANAGCKIIVDDLAYGTGEGFFQTGTVLDNAIESAVASGVDYFSAAGNDSSNYYQGGFTPLIATVTGIAGNAAATFQNFGTTTAPSPYLSVTIPAATTDVPNATINFEWAQPFQSINNGPGAANSFAIYLIDGNGNIVASSTANEVGSDPVQSITFANNTTSTSFRVVVAVNGGTPSAGEQLKMISPNGAVTFNPVTPVMGTGNIFGHELLANTNVVSAVDYGTTPAYGQSPATPTTFDSVGPGQLLYNSAGQPVSTTLSEPIFDAAQGSNTTVNGFSPFNGTSAAAPDAAAVGALMLQANGKLTTTQLSSYLAQSCIPIASAQANAGSGLIQAKAAVELANAAGGSVWSNKAGGDWSTGGNWSAAPTNATAVLVGDGGGTISNTQYTVTVTTAGDTAGSLALGTSSGNSVTLSITGGSLAVGGSNANNVTAGDFLVTNNGTLAMTGGTLSVAGSLNNNNGTVNLTGGSSSADNYAQLAGSFALGSGASLTLTGAGWNETGGAASIGAGGLLTTTVLDDSSASLTVAGTLTDSGALAIGTPNGSSTINLAGGTLSIGTTASGVGLNFASGGTIAFATNNAQTLVGGITSLISGFTATNDALDFTGLTYNAGDTYTATYNGGQLSVFDNGNMVAGVFLSTASTYAAGFKVTKDAGNGVLVSAACFCPGTAIATPSGERAVETLAIGDLVLTAEGEARPIVWIGRRSYNARLLAGRPHLLPVRIRAGALGAGLPRRDLVVSPEHAMLLDGVFVAARHLVNGATIVRDCPAGAVHYLHLELEQQEALLAEGAATESFVDDDSRGRFQNAEEFDRLYPERRPCLAVYRAMRVEDGPELEAIRGRLAGLLAA